MSRFEVRYLNHLENDWVLHSHYPAYAEAHDVYEACRAESYWPRWRLVKVAPEIWFDLETIKRLP